MRYTKEQQQEDRSRAQFGAWLSQQGWVGGKPERDLGWDWHVAVYDDGEWSGVYFYAQVKSVADRSCQGRANGDWAHVIETKDLQFLDLCRPSFLIVWNVDQHLGRWAETGNVVRALDQHNAGWRGQGTVTVRFPASDTTEADGSARLRHAAASQLLLMHEADKQQSPCSLSLRFDLSTDVGTAGSASFQRLLDYGDEAWIDGSCVAVDFPEHFRRLFGARDLEIGQVHLAAHIPEQQLQCAVEHQALDGSISRLAFVELRAQKVGRRLIALSNEHQDTPWSFHVRIEDGAARNELTVQLRPLTCTTTRALEACRFADGLAQGGTLQFTRLADGAPLFAGDVPAMDVATPGDGFRRLVGLLADIEKRAGQTVRIPEGWRIDREQAAAILELADVLRHGRLRSTAPATARLCVAAPEPDCILSAPLGEPVTQSGGWQNREVVLWGTVFCLGPGTIAMSGRVQSTALIRPAQADCGDAPALVQVTVEVEAIEETYTRWTACGDGAWGQIYMNRDGSVARGAA
jgi:hypothetical protein